MKNILKKIGLVAIIVGVLSPFITLPSVNAADNCKNYLNKYFFLDVLYAAELENYEDEYTTYTSFHFNFPKLTSNQTIVFEEPEIYELNTDKKIKSYHGYVKQLLNDKKRSIKDIENDGIWEEEETEKYESVTSLLHGRWGFEDEETDAAGWKIDSDSNKFVKQTLQGTLIDIDKYESDILNIDFGGAGYDSSDDEFFGAGSYSTDLKGFLNKINNDYNTDNSKSFDEGYIYKDEGNIYLNIAVTRSIDENDMKDLNFGHEDNGKYYIWSTTNDSSNITNSYTALMNHTKNSTDCQSKGTCYQVEVSNGDNIDIRTDEQYFWPAILNVKYKICTTSQTADPTPSNPDVKWNLKYNANVDDNSVKNVPDNVTGITGNSVKLSDAKPERTDYVFKAWCTEKDGKGTCKNSGELLLNEEMKDMELFAQWQKAGTEVNDKKGVMSYIIGFLTVGLIAGTLYYVINKKNLFKQI